MISRLHVTRNHLDDTDPRATRPSCAVRRSRIREPRVCDRGLAVEKERRIKLYQRQVAAGRRIKFAPRERG